MGEHQDRLLKVPCACLGVPQYGHDASCLIDMAIEAISEAEAEGRAAGRKAERERVVEWIKAEARDCGCWERILKNVEAADG